jgi:cardiolipin synthase
MFMPLWHSPIRGRTNLRSHRKITIVDGETVFLGGMNLAAEYMGPPRAPTAPPRWRDVAAVVRGPVASDATALFESDWHYCGGRSSTQDAVGPTIEPCGDARVQLVPSGPDTATDTMYDLLLTAIFRARAGVAIVTPYFIPDEALQHALVLCARRGVKTELVIPARSNHRIADVARRRLVRELRANGVVVRYYTRGMIHAKAAVVDAEFAYVGSLNFDMRSLFLNYEDALCLYSEPAISEVRAFIDALASECTTELSDPSGSRVIEQLALLFAPEL